MTFELRPYQAECVQAALSKLYAHDTTLAVLATGLGKTRIFIEVARQFPRVLVMAHRQELVNQAAKQIHQLLGVQPGIEMAGRHSFFENIIVGSVQSVKSRALFLPPPDLVVIDEAHHAVASTYREILAIWPNAKVFGVTATPDRTDHAALGEVFNSVCYKYETPQAIKDGWLAPIVWGKAEGVDGLIFESVGRRTVVFTPSVDSALYVADELGRSAGVVHGKMAKKQRTKTLESFKRGELTHMINCNILTEGFDCPEIECVAMLRTTQSRSMFMQTLGRGLRLAPGKQDCLYLDLTMEMPDHSLECPPGDMLGGHGSAQNLWSSLWT